MQYEKTSNLATTQKCSRIKLSACRTFYILPHKPLSDKRFLSVEKFHVPGYAPVSDHTGAYHINFDGEEIYSKRFLKSYGFYCDRAAVEDKMGCHHIDFAGNKSYKRLYDWIGNYQENICVVRKSSKFYHIDLYGNKIYKELYDYVGDFKDGIAVVYLQGQATHINRFGNYIHDRWYKQLGVFHKGFATAQDNKGWLHVDIKGNAIYSQRYKEIEPFYNGVAKVEKYDGTLEQIDTQGNTKFIIFEPILETKINKISGELAGFWNTYLIAAAIELNLLELLPSTLELASKQLAITEDNLERLFRALWGIELLEYNRSTGVWKLASKGVVLRDIGFLQKAALMWPRVASQENWLRIIDLLKQPIQSSFLSFKEKEESDDLKTQFYESLIGYTSIDTKKFGEQISLENSASILLFGVHSLAIIDMLKTEHANRDKTNDLEIEYYNNPEIPTILCAKYDVKLVAVNESIKNYDMAICCRFLQNYDDEKLLLYLELIKQKKIPRFLIIETLLDNLSSIGGAVDINIMVETGGKLRKLRDWEVILKQIGYNIWNISYLTEYLSVIDIRC